MPPRPSESNDERNGPLADLLGSSERFAEIAAPDAVRERAWLVTTRVVRRRAAWRRATRSAAAVLALAASFVAGHLYGDSASRRLGWGNHSQPAERPSAVPADGDVRELASDPFPPVDAALPGELRGLGDRSLDSGAVDTALAYYVRHLDAAEGAASSEVDLEDSWLLTHLKLARKESAQ